MNNKYINRRSFKEQIISLTNAYIQIGLSKREAIKKAIANKASILNGDCFKVGERSVYRWLSIYELSICKKIKNESSKSFRRSILKKEFVDFLIFQKTTDPACSIPDVIKSAEIEGIIKEGEVSRVTVWREARKLSLSIHGALGKREFNNKRRFEYKHRMQMVLCDGKHFRAGKDSVKRVVFNFIDDSTRKIIASVVGKSESKVLFLKGIKKVLLRYGKMNCLYLDKGSGFIAKDVGVICSRFGINLIFGATAYPEGHGKIERFNKTIWEDLLRTIPNDSSIDVGLSSLELMIEHYIKNVYNSRKHSSLGGLSPDEKWNSDHAGLRSIDNIEEMESFFIVTKARKVSADNIVKIDGVNYEVPLGYSGKYINIEQDFCNNVFRVLHEGSLVRISMVDLYDNAKSNRVKRPTEIETTSEGIKNNATRRSFAKTFKPIVSPDGDFPIISEVERKVVRRSKKNRSKKNRSKHKLTSKGE